MLVQRRAMVHSGYVQSFYHFLALLKYLSFICSCAGRTNHTGKVNAMASICLKCVYSRHEHLSIAFSSHRSLPSFMATASHHLSSGRSNCVSCSSSLNAASYARVALAPIRPVLPLDKVRAPSNEPSQSMVQDIQFIQQPPVYFASGLLFSPFKLPRLSASP